MTTHRSLSLILVAALALAACSPSGGGTPSATATPVAVINTVPPAISSATPGGPGQQWPAPPTMTIDPTKIYLATFKTAKGDIKVQLFADKAPQTVNNFIFLAKAGFYNNTTFHRVIASFMAQGGDPTGTGSGGPGYQFADEFHPDLTFAEPGLLAMANGGPGTNGSQFFITYVPTEWLTGLHTIFGKVVEGMDVALTLTVRDPQAATTPGDALKTVIIEELSQSLLPAPTPTPVPVVPALVDGRPLAQLAIADRANLFTGQPAMVIDPAKIYSANILTTKGAITAELYPADAPQSVNSFYVLANLGYWDNFPIIYVQPVVSDTTSANPAMALTGSPDGSPTSDVGYVLPPEIKRLHADGALGYWFRQERSGSSGSQFFILFKADPRLDSTFTAFGQVTAGLDIAQTLTISDTITMITVTEK